MTIKRQWTGRLELESHLIAGHSFKRIRLVDRDEAALNELHEKEHARRRFVAHEHPQEKPDGG